MVIETKHAFLRNLHTSWLESGKSKKQIMLFLHGYPDTPEVWSEQVKHFSSEYHIICPYSRGTFASEPGSGLSRFSSHSICLDLLEILKIADPKSQKPVIVVGHDLGGAVAWKLATYLSKRLHRLIIINSLSLEQMSSRLRHRPKQWLYSWYIFPFLIPKLSEQVINKFSKDLLPWAYQFGGLKPDRFPKSVSNSPFPVATLRQYRAFVKEILLMKDEKPARIKSSTMVLWGKNDSFLLPPTMNELESYAENLTVRILNGGHWIFRESPELINNLIKTFCQNEESHGSSTKKAF